MQRVICLFIGYVFGLFETGYIYGKLNGIDIRNHGSGNAGATNTLRVLGKKAGVIVLLGDVFKTILAVVICRLIFKNSCSDYLPLIGIYAAAGAILGHNFPVQLGFKGGKGIACTAGLILTLGPVMTICEIITFVGIVLLTRYVSLGSIFVVIELVVILIIQGQTGVIEMSQPHLLEMYIVAAALAAMAIYRHRANIRRLLNGTENKIFSKKDK